MGFFPPERSRSSRRYADHVFPDPDPYPDHKKLERDKCNGPGLFRLRAISPPLSLPRIFSVDDSGAFIFGLLRPLSRWWDPNPNTNPNRIQRIRGNGAKSRAELTKTRTEVL
ncbi:hypothetical protein M5D96_005829 [Drosophila gunungcola]|uniref:Uncharacterized protein n=1 Tax=Drosophila gunungcola TaxID=103775 RepID=A0A9P9YRX9_9MUSC|nr:hypothetical protein M5D96_005829 [Drosophila gunungcola]